MGRGATHPDDGGLPAPLGVRQIEIRLQVGDARELNVEFSPQSRHLDGLRLEARRQLPERRPHRLHDDADL
jgi:hypothetical protein